MSTLKNFVFKSKYCLFLAVAVNFLLHLPFMNEPPQSVHTWRQCNTLAMARNFYQEEMNILHPRVDNRGNTPGITGSHFPAYEYILASLYQLFGEEFWVHRYLSFIIFLFGGCGLYLLFRHLFAEEIISRIAFIAYLFSPELFYHQINALPDILALSASIWGFYLFILWFDFEKPFSAKAWFFIITATFFTTLAGLTKLQYLAIGFPIAVYFLLRYRKLNLTQWITSGVYAGISVIMPVYWYLHAAEMIKKTGLADFGLEFRPETNLSKAFDILSKNIYSWLPETILNFASFTLLLIGVYYIFKKKAFSHKWFAPFLIYALALIAYHLIELKQMEHHGYYMMPYYPVLLVLVGYGALILYRKKLTALLILLIVAQPVLAAYRILPARWMKKKKGYYPEVLYSKDTRNHFANLVPDSALCIVGPDESRCIMFYLIKKKGFGFGNQAELFEEVEGQPKIERMIEKGAKYIYLQKTDTASNRKLMPYISKIIKEDNQIMVAELKEADNN